MLRPYIVDIVEPTWNIVDIVDIVEPTLIQTWNIVDIAEPTLIQHGALWTSWNQR